MFRIFHSLVPIFILKSKTLKQWLEAVHVCGGGRARWLEGFSLGWLGTEPVVLVGTPSKSQEIFCGVQWISQKNHPPTSFLGYDWLQLGNKMGKTKFIFMSVSRHILYSVPDVLRSGSPLENTPSVFCLKRWRGLAMWGKNMGRGPTIPYELWTNPPFLRPCLLWSSNSFWDFQVLSLLGIVRDNLLIRSFVFSSTDTLVCSLTLFC